MILLLSPRPCHPEKRAKAKYTVVKQYCTDTTNSSCLVTRDGREELDNSSKGRWTRDISQNTLKFSKKIPYMVAPQGGNFFVPLQNHIWKISFSSGPCVTRDWRVVLAYFLSLPGPHRLVDPFVFDRPWCCVAHWWWCGVVLAFWRMWVVDSGRQWHGADSAIKIFLGWDARQLPPSTREIISRHIVMSRRRPRAMEHSHIGNPDP